VTLVRMGEPRKQVKLARGQTKEKGRRKSLQKSRRGERTGKTFQDEKVEMTGGRARRGWAKRGGKLQEKGHEDTT